MRPKSTSDIDIFYSITNTTYNYIFFPKNRPNMAPTENARLTKKMTFREDSSIVDLSGVALTAIPAKPISGSKTPQPQPQVTSSEQWRTVYKSISEGQLGHFKSSSAPATTSGQAVTPEDNESGNNEEEGEEEDEEGDEDDLSPGQDETEQREKGEHPNLVALKKWSNINIEDAVPPDDDSIQEVPPTPPRRSVENLDIDNDLAHIQGFLDEDQQSFIDAVKENAHSLLERECTVREVIVVWENCSKFIILKMLEGFAVRVAGLGTFTYAVLPNDFANGKITLKKTRKFPVLKISPYLREMYDLVEENNLYTCNAPVVALNLSVIASDTKLPYGIVDGVITEVLQAFARGIITDKNLEFPFPFIGKLYIQDKRVEMIFYQQFCEGLSFDFTDYPSITASVFPGDMSPLSYHRPQPDYRSVFHFHDIRSVGEKIAAKPRPYAKGNLKRDDSGNPCEFMQKLHAHSNLLFHCSCCKHNDEEKEACAYSRNYDRVQKACCMQKGRFTFQQPDGSTFSPEPLYATPKTGNPLLDKLAEDKCLLQQAIGCWIKRDFVRSLGKENVAKHYDRSYFQPSRKKENVENEFEEGKINTGTNSKPGYMRKKSYLVRESSTKEKPGSTSSIKSTKSVNSTLVNEDFEEDGEGESGEGPSSTSERSGEEHEAIKP